MFCPNCGNQAAGDQKFCRSCGMNLLKVSTAVAEHLGSPDSGEFQIEPAKDLRRKALRRVFWAMALIFAGIVVSVTGENFIHDEQVRGVGALIAIAGIFLTGYFFLSASYKPTSPGRLASPGAKSYEAKTTSRLHQEELGEKLSDAPSSITEQTTGLLASPSIESTGRPAGRNRNDELKV
jgi:hypothetical protein